MRATGVAGSVRVGGREAAALGRWAYQGTRDGWTVTGTVTRTDSFWLDGAGPFDLRLQVGTARWTWKGVGVRVADGDITVTGEGVPVIDG